MPEKQTRVGVGVIVVRNGKVLLGRRKGAHGEGAWGFPGGHLEFNETFEACAAREVMEETGLKIERVKKVTFTNDIFSAEGKHYVTCYLKADHVSGEPQVKEPGKCEGWSWFPWHALPEPLFLPIRNLLKEDINPI